MAIQTHEFDSGLRVFVDHMPATHTTALNIHVGVGSVNESDEQAGLSHIVEHCAFNGTPRFNDTQALQNYSRTHQFQINANTSFERTMFPTRGPQLDPMMKVYGSMICESLIDEQSTTNELKVVQREAQMSADNPSARTHYTRAQALYGAPYSRPIIGYVDRLLDFTPEDVKQFYENMYSLGKIAIVTAGKADLQEVLEVTEKYFEQTVLHKNGNTIPTEQSLVQQGQAGDYGVIDEASRHNAALQISCFSNDELFQAAENKETAPAYSIATGLISRRIFNNLREEKQLSYDGGFGMNIVANHPKTATLSAFVTCDPDKINACTAGISESIALAREYEAADIHAEIASASGAQYISIDDPGSRCGKLSQDILSKNEPQTHAETIAHYECLQLEEVKAAIDHVATVFESADTFTFVTSHPDNLSGYPIIQAEL